MSGLPRHADEQARPLLLLLLGGALFGLLLAGAGGVARLRAGEPAGPGIPADVPLPPPPAYPPGSGLATSVGTAVLEEVDLEREVREEQVALLGRIGAQDVEVEPRTACPPCSPRSVRPSWSPPTSSRWASGRSTT